MGTKEKQELEQYHIHELQPEYLTAARPKTII
jgi:hypothetical protein